MPRPHHWIACATILLTLLAASLAADDPGLVTLKGTDFEGGANEVYGAHHHGMDDVNFIYARPTRERSIMRANFELPQVPKEPMYLYVTACDDDYVSQCEIEIRLNRKLIARGPSGFTDAPVWQTRRFRVPRRALRVGANELLVRSLERKGSLGMPPWFMVAQCVLADANYEPPPDQAVTGELRVKLPRKLRALPRPLPAGHTEPGFAIRGTKGWLWKPEQYLAEIPHLAEYKMNFLMNCYGSMFDLRPHWVNEWWKPMPDEKKEAYARIIRACKEHGITYCFAFHPQLAAPRRLDPTNEADREAFWQHYQWAQSEGAQWFNISLDDVDWGSKGPETGGLEHARLVNWFLERLRDQDPEAQLSFVPVPYWGDGTRPDHRAYLDALAREMHPDVYVFWTGDGVVTPRITRKAAESYKSIVGHRLILWDNYPVNDGNHTVHLGPVTGRDPDLCEVVDGYMSNPHHKQNQVNRIPLMTCADYAYNPWDYDPRESIGQAIAHFSDRRAQRQALAELVEAYPGMLIYGGGTGVNPVRTRLQRMLDRSERLRYVDRMEGLSKRMDRLFPNALGPTRNVLREDVRWMREAVAPTEVD